MQVIKLYNSRNWEAIPFKMTESPVCTFFQKEVESFEHILFTEIYQKIFGGLSPFY